MGLVRTRVRLAPDEIGRLSEIAIRCRARRRARVGPGCARAGARSGPHPDSARSFAALESGPPRIPARPSPDAVGSPPRRPHESRTFERGVVRSEARGALRIRLTRSESIDVGGVVIGRARSTNPTDAYEGPRSSRRYATYDLEFRSRRFAKRRAAASSRSPARVPARSRRSCSRPRRARDGPHPVHHAGVRRRGPRGFGVARFGHARIETGPP